MPGLYMTHRIEWKKESGYSTIICRSDNILFMCRGLRRYGKRANPMVARCRNMRCQKVGLWVLCKACNSYLQLLNDGLVQGEQEHGQENDQDIVNEILLFCKEPKTVKEIMAKFNIPNCSYLKRYYMDQMLEEGLLKMTIPEQPHNRNQTHARRITNEVQRIRKNWAFRQ